MPRKPGTDAPYARKLPRPATVLIGREAEVTEICARFEQGARLVTLTGPGGVGKTRVALAAAERLESAYPAGAAFIPLATIADHRLVIPTIARTMGILEQSDLPVLNRIIDYLRDRQMLLILDNVEHVVAAANSVAELLHACLNLSILATSREPLHISGEWEYAVPPLPLLDTDQPPSGTAHADNDAVRLFVERATGVSSAFALTDANAPAVSAICYRVGGLPLAIELAAARIKVLSPKELLARLDPSTGPGSLAMLTGGPRDAPGRQQTMRDTIQWSYDLLTDDEQRAFRHLSVFAGGWTLDAAEAVVDQIDSFEILTSLIDKSLVQRFDRPGQPDRFWMLEPIRQFGLELLSQDGDERRLVRRRHAMYVLAMVDGLEERIDGPDAANWFERIESEHDNVRAALRWSMETGEVEIGLFLVARVAKFWDQRGYVIEGIAHIESFLDLPAARHWTLGRGLAAYVGSRLNDRLGRSKRVVPLADEACAIFEEHGHDFYLAQALLIRGVGHFQAGDDARAEADWEQALPLLRVAGRDAYTVRALIHLSELARRRGYLDQCRVYVSEALDLARDTDSTAVISLSLKHLGLLEEASGNADAAAEHYRERMRINRILGMPWATAQTLEHLARHARRVGQLERAVCLLGSAAALRVHSGSPFIATDGFEIDDEMDALQDALPEDVFQTAWSRGQSMSMIEACDYALQDESDDSTVVENPTPMLTQRELEVLRLLVDGKSNQEIAGVLFISYNTVTTHVANIMNKLGLDSRTAVATWAVRNGVV